MWNAEIYGRFERERMQPSIDLVSRIPKETAAKILDVGCGSGMSTLPLRKRFPAAEITGADLSANMLEEAKRRLPDVTWVQRDCGAPLTDLGKFDIVFSNAFLQWLSRQEEFIAGTVDLLSSSGVLALQIPDFDAMPAAAAIQTAVAKFDADGTIFHDTAQNMHICHSAPAYYDMCSRYYSNLSLWETTYLHQLPDHAAIVQFLKSTALNPYLEQLDDSQAKLFLDMTKQELQAVYPISANGTVLFGFQRIFLLCQNEVSTLY